MEETRTIPNNIDAEQGVLSAMLLGEEYAINEMMNMLAPDDFYREAHREIYRRMQELVRLGKVIDSITLVDALRTAGKLEDVGGMAYILSIAAKVPTTANIKYHAQIILDKARLRKMIETGTEIVKMGYEPDSDDVQDIIDRAESKILAISQTNKAATFSPMNTLVKNTIDKLSELSNSSTGFLGIPTGIIDFDKMTSGLQPSDFIILAARPSMGKTALALNIAAEVALRSYKKLKKDPLKVAIFSLEMSKEQLVSRMLCAEARVDSSRLRVGDMNEDEWGKLWTLGGKLNDAHIYIDDTGGLSSMDIRSRARHLMTEIGGLDLIIIDYLQLMRGSGRRSSEDNRQAEVSEISRSLKSLARELKLPIIALSQLSRAVESRTSKRPMLSDLRESGSLEQDADIVAFLYRDDYYNKDTDHPHVTELIIAKHRNGATGVVNLFFEEKFTRFRDMSKRPE
ncbi:MAG: replicative DNA helicase [Acidaminococcaceae bacterium]|nr:replicative DNA helicase [Acidaminococcaceae bacterium]